MIKKQFGFFLFIWVVSSCSPWQKISDRNYIDQDFGFQLLNIPEPYSLYRRYDGIYDVKAKKNIYMAKRLLLEFRDTQNRIEGTIQINKGNMAEDPMAGDGDIQIDGIGFAHSDIDNLSELFVFSTIDDMKSK